MHRAVVITRSSVRYCRRRDVATATHRPPRYSIFASEKYSSTRWLLVSDGPQRDLRSGFCSALAVKSTWNTSEMASFRHAGSIPSKSTRHASRKLRIHAASAASNSRKSRLRSGSGSLVPRPPKNFGTACRWRRSRLDPSNRQLDDQLILHLTQTSRTTRCKCPAYFPGDASHGKHDC